MHNGNCGCYHHWCVKILMVLAWVAGILFFWSSWGTRAFWGFDALYWGWSVVVLVLMAKVTMFCGCCKWGMGTGSKMEDSKMMCTHQPDCKCGDCPRCM